MAGAAFTLAVVHGLAWFRSLSKWAYFFFFTTGIAATASILLELVLIRSPSVAHYSQVLYWLHFSVGIELVSIVWFFYFYLGTGRLWMAWLYTASRGAILAAVVAFPSANFSSLSGLHPISLLGETVVLPVGEPSPLWGFMHLSNIIFMIFVIDSAIHTWKKGRWSRALVLGGGTVLAMLIGTFATILMERGAAPSPLLAPTFFLVVLAMTHEISRDFLRVNRLSRDIKESQERMRFSAKAVNLSLWEWDVLQDRIWTSEAGRNRVGVGASETISFKRFLDAVHPEDREQTRNKILTALNQGGEFVTEYRITPPHGKLQWIELHGLVEQRPNGKPLRVRGVSVDITVRKETTLKLDQKRAELAHIQRVASLDQLSGTVAHEINQPLGAILRNAEAAELYLQKSPPDLKEVKEIVADIRRDNKRAVEVVGKLRSLMKRRTHQMEPVDLGEVINSVSTLLQAEWQPHRIDLRRSVSPGLPPVLGDRVYLQQVLVNLILNSVDALKDSPHKRRINVMATETPEGDVELAVQDNGPGFPLKKIHQVFESFVTTKTHGTGIGLSISRSIVEHHGGRIWAENNPNGGATVRLHLKTALSKVPA